MMPEIYAIAGNPVAHSKSPGMHNAAFRELGLDAVYVRLASDSAEDAMETAKQMGIKGFNITAPFKEDFLGLVDEIDEDAKAIGAINTVIIREGKSRGYNVDTYGVKDSLLSKGVELKGRKAWVLGAGGAAKAAAYALISEGAEVLIANRTVEKAKALADELECRCCSLDELGEHMPDCDIIVSCISSPVQIVPKELLRKEMAVFDANYAAKSPLIRDAEEKGCRIIDGRDWLLYQGVKAFELFTGRDAPLEAMRKAVYENPGEADKRNIALIGMMGSGKDAAAGKMAEKSGMEILDMDAEIERKAGIPITQIFEQKGEEEFRRMESEEVSALGNEDHRIVNCGGGAVISQQNRKTLKGNALVVLLWAKPQTLLKRIPDDGRRPLLNVDDPQKKLEMLLEERLGHYAEASDIVINTGDKTAEQIAERILYEAHKAVSH